jgi:Flp pilus assembly protein TadG
VKPARVSRQAGSTTVEFALVMLIFLTFLLAITDFSRMLYTWNAANEATRTGARYASVCDPTTNEAQVLAKMQTVLPQITDISLVWEDELGNTSCTTETCVAVTVTIDNLKYKWISPIAGLAGLAPLNMPRFKTYLTREIMGMDPNSYSGANICS